MSGRLVSQRTYVATYAALIALTIATVGISFVELGDWHSVAGFAIAAGKGTLVALIFMHAWYSSRLVWAVLGAGLVWIGILFSFTLADYLTRAWLAF